jgi:hypothetical protein
MSEPRQVKGGVLAPADIGIIKDALLFYAKSTELSPQEEKQVVNLIHRLGRAS